MLDFIAKPFGILMMWLYRLTHNYMLAVILFSLIVKLILLPFQMKSKKGMMRQQLLMPQQQELAKKYGSNQQKYQAELMKLYQEEHISPMSGCLWALLPFPILIALYSAIRKPLSTMMGIAASELQSGGRIFEALAELGHKFSSDGYGEIAAVKVIHEHWSDVFEGLGVAKLRDMNYMSFGLDLGAQPSFKLWTWDWSSVSEWLPALGLFLIPIVATLLSILPTKLTKKLNAETMKAAGLDPTPQEQQGQGFLTIFMPLMTLWFCFIMPAALGVYWIANSLFGVIQDIVLTKHYNKTVAAESAERIAARKAREAELERKRQESERRRAEEGSVENASTSKRKQQNKKKKEQTEKSLEWQRTHNPEEPVYEPSRVGTRRYARGRAYDPDRFTRNGVEGATEDTSALDEAITEEQEEKLQRAALSGSVEEDANDGDGKEDEGEVIDEGEDEGETDNSIIE